MGVQPLGIEPFEVYFLLGLYVGVQGGISTDIISFFKIDLERLEK